MSEDSFEIGVLEEPFSETELEGTSARSSIPRVAGDEAGPSNRTLPVVPYPYQPDEVIGGDSIHAIERRLLAGQEFPDHFELEQARRNAQDLFEVKVEIIRTMAVQSPVGSRTGRGARALENPRTATGEDSLERLFAIRDDLTRRRDNSDFFNKLKEKVFLRGEGADEHSAT